jgi:hypothetical protein
LVKTITPTDAKKFAEINSLSNSYAFFDTVIGAKGGGQMKYKVIAYHSDGGQSTWTNEVNVVIGGH